MGKVLVVGGNGLIGGAAALHLAGLGHAVAIAGRNPPASGPLAALPFIRGSFADESIGPDTLAGFNSLVFAAGNDVRQLPPGADQREYFRRVNSEGIPAFFDRARRAGVSRAVYVGSYYPDVLPAAEVEANGYLISRREADEGLRALAGPGFMCCTLQSPFTVGQVRGVGARQLEMITAYCLRLIEPEGPRFAPPGGSNFMSTRSFAEGIAAALERGEAGRSYLMGDENWSYADYFNHFLEGLGLAERAVPLDVPNPAMVDASLYGGRGRVIAYDPAPAAEALGYRRHDAGRAVREMAPYYAARLRAAAAG